LRPSDLSRRCYRPCTTLFRSCRGDTIKALRVALNLGMATRLTLETPLMWLDKADTWRLAREVGGTALVDLIRRDTHTCYLGERRSEEHTSELQSRENLVCRLL